MVIPARVCYKFLFTYFKGNTPHIHTTDHHYMYVIALSPLKRFLIVHQCYSTNCTFNIIRGIVHYPKHRSIV